MYGSYVNNDDPLWRAHHVYNATSGRYTSRGLSDRSLTIVTAAFLFLSKYFVDNRRDLCDTFRLSLR